ncbi:MAG TPA: PIN domain-containing protein [Phycisphaerae bacterium]|nr:PIN domain-containing protein [Phycisphaerae bacterium]
MVLHLVRVLFLLVVMGVSISMAFRAAQEARMDFLYVAASIIVPVVAGFLLVLVDMLWRRKRLQVLSGLFFGALAGLVIAYGLTIVVNLVAEVYDVMDHPAVPLTKAVLSAAAVFLCITFVLQTKDDFRFVIPYVEFSREAKGARPMLLDTSVIIDGRIADIAETGVLESEVLVPRFILTELHAIADSQDKLKRNRGRRGLDVLDQLQKCEKLDVAIYDAHVPEVERAGEVDDKLVALADHLNGRVVTNDYNLNKVARLRGVDVININDLANALKPVFLPGEVLRVKVIRAGEEPGQGVGYLEDGTMVVAEQGRDHVGREIDITVTSALQTSAGRMIFGRCNAAGPVDRRPARS